MVEEFKDKRLKYLWMIVLYTSAAFLLFFIFYGIKTANGEICTNQIIKNEIDVLTTTQLTSNTYTFPVTIPTKYQQNILGRDICLNMYSNTSAYVGVTLNGVKVYVNNATTDYTCASNVLVNDDKINLTCADCDGSNQLTIVDSCDTGLINDDEVISQGTIPHYIIVLKEHCKELYKDMVRYYFIIIALYLLIFLGMRGGNWFMRWLNDW